MNKTVKVITAAAVGFFGGVVPALSWSAETASKQKPVEVAYQKIDSLFLAGKWEAALQAVDGFRGEFKKSARESSVTRIAAEAALKLRQVERSRLEALAIVNKFKDSEYLDDAHWLLAEAALMAEQWDEAQRQMDWLVGFSRDTTLVAEVKEAQSELRTFLAQFDRLGETGQGAVAAKIGLILPLTGAEPEAVEDYLRGWTVRWLSLNGGETVVYDSEGDPVRAVLLARRLAVEDSVWGIIGGLTEDEAAALAVESEHLKTPFLTTVCRTADLASLSRYTFQGCADYTHVGSELGKHSILDLQLSRFAVLAPLTRAGRQLARGFREAVMSRGGEIVVEEGYFPGTQDFTAQLSRIRAAGRKRTFEDSLKSCFSRNGYILLDTRQITPPKRVLVTESLPPGTELEPGEEPTVTLSPQYLDSLWQIVESQLHTWLEENEDVDTLDTPVDALDGFLMLVEPGSIPFLAPQFARFNFITQLLGGRDWDDRQALQQNARYLNGLVFVEDLTPSGGDDYYRFAAVINQMDNKPVNRNHLAGERAAAMVAAAAKNADGRENLRLALSQLRDLATFSGLVDLLKEERVDRTVKMIRFQDGKFTEEKPVSDQMPLD
jgi:ABC-type branched-subunit amino acid transport system substrate-binding protein